MATLLPPHLVWPRARRGDSDSNINTSTRTSLPFHLAPNPPSSPLSPPSSAHLCRPSRPRLATDTRVRARPTALALRVALVLVPAPYCLCPRSIAPSCSSSVSPAPAPPRILSIATPIPSDSCARCSCHAHLVRAIGTRAPTEPRLSPARSVRVTHRIQCTVSLRGGAHTIICRHTAYIV
ncbi:hypothetical protein BC834DRAFT_858085, partial [Gloeopeniophorella convolvens]